MNKNKSNSLMNNKNLIMCINYALLGFYLCYFRRYYLHATIDYCKKEISSGQIMKALREILANKDIIQKIRDSNFDKEVQVKYEINELKTRKDKELEHIMLRNRYFGRSDRVTEEKRIDEIE